MTSIDTIFNFAKFQYIEKYWVKTVPNDYPADSSVAFSTDFVTQEEKDAVREMESQLGTEESVVTEFVPENNFVSSYLGTFDVQEIENEDGESEVDGKVLLSPVKIEDSDAVMGVVAMHYNPDNSTWENVEDAELVDGYVYGTLTSFSPVAVFTVCKDIEVKEGYLWKGLIAVYANGNPIRVYTTEDGKKVIENKVTGKQYELTSKETVLFGGTSDGSAVKSTSISVEAGKYPMLDIKAGSQSAESQTTVDKINVVINDATIGCLSGSSGFVHTKEVNFKLNNVNLSWIGAGESMVYLASRTYDANARFTPETVGVTAPMKVDKVVMNLTNVNTTLGYVSSNTGMTYTKDVFANITGGKIDYILLCSSNGKTSNVEATLTGVKGTILQSTNRGIIENVKATIKDCEIDNVFVAGDATDSTVNGVVNKVGYDIGKGKYTLLLGTNGGTELDKETAEQIVDKIKFSRAADITINQEVKDVLGNKLVLK